MIKSLKMLFLALCFAPAVSHAAFLSCQYTPAACDENQSHYLCTLVGWTGPNPPQFCSAEDQSRFPVKRADSCDYCIGQPQPDQFCREVCGCTSVFCGAW